MAVSTKRKVSQFQWTAVDPAVIRALLTAVYRDNPNPDNIPKIRKVSDANLAQQAESSMGRPPRSKFFDNDEVVDVLRKKWLPKASCQIVESLAHLVAAGPGNSGKSLALMKKTGYVEYLQARKRTTHFRTALRKQFIAAHKESHLVDARSTTKGELSTQVVLAGEGLRQTRIPYDHQVEARNRLDELSASTRQLKGTIVLPTGAGKTDTIVVWLLNQMQANHDLRVLWITHQRELVGQALLSFQRQSLHFSPSFRRTARQIHGDGSSLSTLADETLDVVTVTIQTLARSSEKPHSPLDRFLERPTWVVVDEAHHAGSPSYDRVLLKLESTPTVKGIIGLTATPYPTSYNARRKFKLHFPLEIHKVEQGKLIATGVLARPVLHTVDTGKQLMLTIKEQAQAIGGDLAAETLADIGQDEARNAVIVRTWLDHQQEWGKTLLFATSISHANHLTELLTKAGAPAKVLHSQVKEHPKELLDWFRRSKEPRVLVSVGMLTEGVDLPDARTAILARPTASRILMQQMIGRVLRGLAAGGDAVANVVYLRDQWMNFGDVIEPPEVMPRGTRTVDRRPGEPPLPDITFDDEGRELPPDLTPQINRIMETARTLANLADDDNRNDRSIDPLLTVSRLIGYFQLPDRTVPVFAHQADGFDQLLTDVLDGYSPQGTGYLSYFDGTPPPYPSRRTLKELVDFVREQEERPDLIELDAHVGPRVAADRIQKAGPLTEADRADLMRDVYANSIAGVAFPSFAHFEERVEAELRELRAAQRHLNPEQPLRQSPAGTKKLPRTTRELEPLRDETVKLARRILPPEHAERLNDPPEVEWTNRVALTTFGHWSIKLTGISIGRQSIRINTLLQSTKAAVPAEQLKYLIYHELLHHLLPAQGHDAEFRMLEARWPKAVELDLWFDTLHERWDIRPESYNGSK